VTVDIAPSTLECSHRRLLRNDELQAARGDPSSERAEEGPRLKAFHHPASRLLFALRSGREYKVLSL
jgi:hypothetical protein